ncbi:lipid A deacylase LpxR family protein [Chitinophaga pendula]|uniref:lipid A deacylase LpxR family protein n=1 Tax=Chitinophaga TaxID=79328 RepID=UPI000BAFB1D3|nr:MULTISPECIES: lipid A deacylase LpxR family protein [Chitinophaga]ASZ10512.1 hypothetical protein CK934_05745 [Chitinophaga sp. MD30]UCJ06515.1 lipid A deacylase LpxR family protein [Chitinophaga pendula]
MKKVLLWLGIVLATTGVKAQIMLPEQQRMLRIYEDNDLFNISGQGTDEAYTNGTRIDYFYFRKKPARSFDKWVLPQTGRNSINRYYWSVMQIMITPTDLATTQYQPNDYSYAGALYGAHGLLSYNPDKKYNLHSEWLLGVMGPWAFAKEAQTLMHRVIDAQRPMGWGNQLPNDLLINYSLRAEKMLWQPASWIDILGGAAVYTGTMINSATINATIRAGYFRPYFGQPTGTTPEKRAWPEIYAYIRPSAEGVFHNALLEGSIFSHHYNKMLMESEYNTTRQRRWSTTLEFGTAVSFRGVAVTYTQRSNSAELKGAPRHEVGNISLYVALP